MLIIYNKLHRIFNRLLLLILATCICADPNIDLESVGEINVNGVSVNITAGAYTPNATPPAPSPPHIFVIVIDDVGYKDFGFQGAIIPTPYSDELSSLPGMCISYARAHVPNLCKCVTIYRCLNR